MARSGLGMRMCSGVSAVRKSRPASSSRTRILGSSERRAASTAPAEPPPTMTKSYSFSTPASYYRRALGQGDTNAQGLDRGGAERRLESQAPAPHPRHG